MTKHFNGEGCSDGIQHRMVGHYVSSNRLPEQPHSERYCPLLLNPGGKIKDKCTWLHGKERLIQKSPGAVFIAYLPCSSTNGSWPGSNWQHPEICSHRYGAVPAIDWNWRNDPPLKCSSHSYMQLATRTFPWHPAGDPWVFSWDRQMSASTHIPNHIPHSMRRQALRIVSPQTCAPPPRFRPVASIISKSATCCRGAPNWNHCTPRETTTSIIMPSIPYAYINYACYYVYESSIITYTMVVSGSP